MSGECIHGFGLYVIFRSVQFAPVVTRACRDKKFTFGCDLLSFAAVVLAIATAADLNFIISSRSSATTAESTLDAKVEHRKELPRDAMPCCSCRPE
jgi:hypothetical protein